MTLTRTQMIADIERVASMICVQAAIGDAPNGGFTFQLVDDDGPCSDEILISEFEVGRVRTRQGVRELVDKILCSIHQARGVRAGEEEGNRTRPPEVT